MAVMTPELQVPRLNRRRRVRHKVHTPAYASFTGASKGMVLDLSEVLDISEDGFAVRCTSPLELNRSYDMCLDLAESKGHIYTSAKAIWSDASGRVGFRFPNLPTAPLLQLRDWLFLNALAAVVNAEPTATSTPSVSADAVSSNAAPRQDYTNILTALSAVQREAESFGPDLGGALRLIAARAQLLVRASGAAIALTSSDPGTMICRASAGPDAPPVGAQLQVGAGFSGECVSTGKILRCDDTETDSRVDRESCRVLGIRSMLAAPIRSGQKVIGIIEGFSSKPGAFHETDSFVLQRLTETILAAINRTRRSQAELAPKVEPPRPFSPPAGSVLFASQDRVKENQDEKERLPAEDKTFGGVRLPRTHLVLLILAAATIALALGFILAPWIQETLQGQGQSQRQSQSQSEDRTVLASSRPPAPVAQPRSASAPVDSVNDAVALEQLRQLAKQGDPAAQNALGVRYATGEGVKQDEREAAIWFTKAAEQGYVIAQSALGARYWAGRGVPQDLPKAYFWTVLARAGGDQGSRTLAPVLASHMTRGQAAAIEQQADAWFSQHQLSQHQSPAKPPAGR